MKRIIISGFTLCLLAACGQTDQQTTATSNDTATLTTREAAMETVKEATGWDSVNFSSPIVRYKTITSKSIETRQNDNYAVYGIIDEVLFNSGSSTMRNDAANTLVQVCKSINEQYSNSHVRIYGYTDSIGTKEANQQLSVERALAVRAFLNQNCNMDTSKISVVGAGESKPVADNSHASGREQNRRVRIVVKR